MGGEGRGICRFIANWPRDLLVGSKANETERERETRSGISRFYMCGTNGSGTEGLHEKDCEGTRVPAYGRRSYLYADDKASDSIVSLRYSSATFSDFCTLHSLLVCV